MSSRLPDYVLVTPVHNEARDVEKTLTSVTSQTVRPLRWVIVDDGSTDKTADIVRGFVDRHDWIELIRLPRHDKRSFGSKVRSFNAGFERVKDLPYDVVGNLDGDISFDPDYIEFLLRKFQGDPALGVAGTVFREEGYRSDVDSFEGAKHVPGGCQLFRRETFDQIGGFRASPHGGVDWIAVTTARMRGWKTRSFREKYFFHHRPLGTAQRGALATAYSVRAERLLRRRPPGVGADARGLPCDPQTVRARRRRAGLRLLRFVPAAAAAHRVERVHRVSSLRTDREAESCLRLGIPAADHRSVHGGRGVGLAEMSGRTNLMSQHSGAAQPGAVQTISPILAEPLEGRVTSSLAAFEGWLDRYGETSYDFQTFYAGPVGQWAKGFYYKNKKLGTLAVAPIIFCEAFAPSARRFFFIRQRFPIADAHYAMGYARMFRATGDPQLSSSERSTSSRCC